MYRPFQFNKRSQFFIRTNDEKIVRPSESTADTQPQLQPALLEIVSDYFPVLHAHLNAVNVFLNPGQAESREIYLPSDSCRDWSGLNLCATRFFRRIQQKLAAAKINGSRPFAHAKNSLLAKACDRLILESQLTPGLATGLHGCALVNIIVHCTPDALMRSMGALERLG